VNFMYYLHKLKTSMFSGSCTIKNVLYRDELVTHTHTHTHTQNNIFLRQHVLAKVQNNFNLHYFMVSSLKVKVVNS